MSWLHPAYSWALLAVPLAAWFFWHALRRRRRAQDALGHGALIDRLTPTVSPKRRRTKAVLVLGAVLLLGAALVGPRFGTKLRQVERRGVDLLIALDVSQSMRAEDVAPSRLRRAKREINTLLDALPGGDRVGLVVFAGDAFLQCPLTTDYAAVRLFLDVAGPDLIGTPGTEFLGAWRAAEAAFQANAGGTEELGPRAQALLFVSDGEDHAGGVEAITQQAREAGVAVLATGVGTPEGGTIPLYNDDGRRTGYKRDRRGEIVRTRLQEDALQALANDGYFRIGRTQSTLGNLPAALRQMEQSSLGSDEFEEYNEQFQWPLALALLLLLAEPLFRSRRTGETASERRETTGDAPSPA